MARYIVIKYHDLRRKEPRTIELKDGKATVRQILAGDFDIEVLSSDTKS